MWARIFTYAFLAIGIIWFYNIYPILFNNVSTPLSISSLPVATPTPDQIDISEPVMLIIPSIGIRTAIVPVGKTRSGNLDVPKSLKNVGWHKDGVKPGQFGNAVIDGHEVDQFGLGVIFKNLHKLQEGDKVYIETKDGTTLTFDVTRKEVYKYNNAPLQQIFGATTSRNLNLITCDGDYQYRLHTKDKRLVVYTTLVN